MAEGTSAQSIRPLPHVRRGRSGRTPGWPLVQKKTITVFEDEPLRLQEGGELSPITVAYETWGEMNADGSNVILVCHALTGDSHAAGVYSPEDPRPGWWDRMVGPGLPIDTDRYFVICQNVLGGCQGTTGPSSINPATGRPYGMSFPVITIRDMVRVQHAVLQKLGIRRLLAVVGGSLGGMQALEWAVTFPDMAKGIIAIAANGRFHPQGIAFNEVQRQAIMSDPNWRNGDYYGGPGPRQGLAVARMLGMITYRSDESMHRQFGREHRAGGHHPLGNLFEVESYLHHQGQALVKRFDANSYLYLSRAMDLHDLGRGYPSYEDALRRVQARLLVVGIRSDLLFPPYQQIELVRTLTALGKDARYFEMDSPWGHDAFLVDCPLLDPAVPDFLRSLEDHPS